jgi:hemerythrin-like domain-containing protein
MSASFPGFPSPAPGFDEPLEMLDACHGRIEAQLATLERLVEHLAREGCDARAQEAARAVMRYFDTAGANHHCDEEEDLFPLLRQHAARLGRGAVASAIDALEHEHAHMHDAYDAVRAQLEEVAGGRSARLDIEAVGRLAWLYRQHIERESNEVFGFAREVLSPGERDGLGRRMAARRGAAVE